MTYVRRTRIFRLCWPEDSELSGLEVRVKSIPIGTLLLDLGPLAEGYANVDLKDATGEDVKKILRPFQVLADSIVSWNIETEDDEGNRIPVEPDLDGILSLDTSEVQEILRAWTEAAASVPAPLGTNSSTGAAATHRAVRQELEDTLTVSPLS